MIFVPLLHYFKCKNQYSGNEDGMRYLLSPGKRIASRQLWMGRPAKYARDLTDAALADMQAGVAGYVENGRIHRAAVDGAAQG